MRGELAVSFTFKNCTSCSTSTCQGHRHAASSIAPVRIHNAVACSPLTQFDFHQSLLSEMHLGACHSILVAVCKFSWAMIYNRLPAGFIFSYTHYEVIRICAIDFYHIRTQLLITRTHVYIYITY